MSLSDLTLNHIRSAASVSPAHSWMFDVDDIIARDDAAELADFMGHSTCKGNLSEEGRSAIVRFRNHTIEIDTRGPLAIKIDSISLDAPSHPRLTALFRSLLSALQPPAALAS